MTEALLLVGHGSRVAEGNRQFLSLVEEVRAAIGGGLVQPCFIELAEPDVGTGLARCVAAGAERVVVLPVMLFAAGHAKVEIPGYLDEARRRYPQVEFAYGRPFGVDPLLLEVVGQRFSEVEAVAQGPFDRTGTGVVLVGRGSSDADANSDLAKIARLLAEGFGFLTVEVSYTGVALPDPATAVRRAVRLGAERVVVLPYLLFDGVLLRRLAGWVDDLRRELAAVPIHLGTNLGGHPNLVEVLLARRREAREGTAAMNCASCRWRPATAAEVAEASGPAAAVGQR